MSTWMHQLYNRGGRQKGSGGSPPVLRITHRVCCVDTLETLLPVMNQFISGPGEMGLLFQTESAVPATFIFNVQFPVF